MTTQIDETPQIEIAEDRDAYARIVVEPLPPGFGITVGNAMRRVLLSSLPGAAITAVRIDDVEHEFSAIPGVKEDTTEFLLNLKGVRLRALSDRPGKLWLEVQGGAEGKRVVYARDIQTTADYEIVNPDLYLATLDSADAHLTVELSVERGVGYRPAGSVTGLPIGMIPTDAIFTPVRRANFQVEHTRVGSASNYDRLILEVWTDGSIRGVEAFAQAADILIRHFSLLSHLGRPTVAAPERSLGPAATLSPDRYNTPIEALNLSVRAYNCLKRSGLMTVGQVLEKSEEELLGLRNFGRKSYEELREKLIEMGFIDRSQMAPSSSAAQETEDEFGEEEDEELGTLGAALMEALRGRSENRNTSIDFLRRGRELSDK